MPHSEIQAALEHAEWIHLTPAEQLARLAVRSRAIDRIEPALEEPTHFYRPARFNAPRYAGDGVLIAGDAAHATNPALGFGMNLAMRDAGVAADVVSAAWRRGRSERREARHRSLAASDLREYEARYRSYNGRVIQLSHRQSLLTRARGALTALVREALVRATWALPFARWGPFGPLYRDFG